MSLAARDVTKRFGGLTALSRVSLDVMPGEVHGLIGPNGSGKTTLLNLLSGYYRPDEGAIQMAQQDLSSATVQQRANLGIARTFQKPRLLPTLSVLDNAMIGGWRDARAGFLATAFMLPRASFDERELRNRAEELLHGVGLSHAISRRANLLEHAEQRCLEHARALTHRPQFMLLDEPAGGLTPAEIEYLGGVIRVIAESGVGVLLVEHHTDFVFRISDRVTTLDVGAVIKHGTPDQVKRDPEVVRVYLGA
jgi:ABC-type branched-subunit amino acid transport system ATPase component